MTTPKRLTRTYLALTAGLLVLFGMNLLWGSVSLTPQAVLAALRGIAPLNIASWTEPKGGYFVSCDAMPGTAKRTLALCAEAGVTMTPAGATYPGGNDPADSNIRIAPSFPPVEELEQAMQIFCLALRMAALERLGL